MEQIGGNNRGIISYIIVVGVFFFFNLSLFPISRLFLVARFIFLIIRYLFLEGNFFFLQ